jgi:ATP-dependent Lhr-like helicase
VPFPLPPSPITDWFRRTFGEPTQAQAEAWPKILAGRHVLVVSPTGTGKTLAAFLAILHELALRHTAGTLEDTIYAIYVSPLRALGYDLEKNLQEPLRGAYGEASPIRVALRSGDTSSAERRRQATQPPHVLLTTPESLLILLSQTKWLEPLRTVRWVVIDEVHALAENKRGAHLSLSLERLAEWVAGRPQRSGPGHYQRIGLSATVAPVDEVARFLVGVGRDCDVVDVGASKRIEMSVHSPLGSNPYPVAGFTGVRLVGELGELVRRHRTTLVFTNTRSGAEATTFWLKSATPELANQIECHHGSLDRDSRLEVEDRLKRGELRAVVCSTSLELGIDIGSIDLVVMIATPKGVSRAVQRTGRAGHSVHAVSRGILMATNLNDLVECCATVLLARQRGLDAVRIPQAPLDVLAQHLVGMGCTRSWTRVEALAMVRQSHVYRDLPESELSDVLDYLAGGGRSLRAQYREVFGRIQLSEEGFETPVGTIRRDYLQNAGTIPSEGMVNVRWRMRSLGAVEESFMRMLRPGDVFMLGGRPVRLMRVSAMEAFVERADHASPTVPRWNANKMPLSNRVATEIATFRAELRRRFETGDPRDPDHAAWIATRLDCGLANAGLIHRMYRAQHELSEIPTADAVLVEEMLTTGEDASVLAQVAGEAGASDGSKTTKRRRKGWVETARASEPARHYFVHALIGRSANDALSRVMAARLGTMGGGNVVVTPDDYGFVMTVAADHVLPEAAMRALLAPAEFGADLDRSLARSALLKHHFRNAAQTGLMVYRNYFGDRKPVRKLQFSVEVIFNVLAEHEPDHVLMREARRDAMHTYLDLPGALAFAERSSGMPIRFRRVNRVPPLSFSLYATKIREALMVEDPREALERLYHHWWAKIEGGSA